jgi:hypothetical protein
VRGIFSPIRTNLPGVHISELLPRMDKVALIRSVHHKHSSHNGGMHWATVGRPYRVDSTLINPSRSDIPCVGTLCGWLAQRDGFSSGVPPYVITPFPHCDSNAYITPAQYGGCLGAQFDPFVLDDDPNAPGFKVPNLSLDASLTPARLTQRVGPLKSLGDSQNSPQSQRIVSPQAAETDIFSDKAVSIVQSEKAAQAFDLTPFRHTRRSHRGRGGRASG